MRLNLLLFIFEITLLLGCSDFGTSRFKNRSTNTIVKRKVVFINSQFGVMQIQFNPNGDTLTMDEYVPGKLQRLRVYYSKNKRKNADEYINKVLAKTTRYDKFGNIQSSLALILGTKTINSYIRYNSHFELQTDNSNITLKQVSSDSLLIGFYAPFPDEIELIFKPHLKSSKVLETININSFSNNEVVVKLSKKYYPHGTLNLIVRKKWCISALIRTQHDTYIQLDNGEQVEPNNLDPIVL
jgi:hypothetical protein